MGLGRSSIYLGTCQDEPEQLDDWNRIAELQQRNRACPPHLKTCYPLESRVRAGGAKGLPLPGLRCLREWGAGDGERLAGSRGAGER